MCHGSMISGQDLLIGPPDINNNFSFSRLTPVDTIFLISLFYILIPCQMMLGVTCSGLRNDN